MRDPKVQLARELWGGNGEGSPDSRAKHCEPKNNKPRLIARGLGQLPVSLLLSKMYFYMQTTVIEVGGRIGHLLTQQADISCPPLCM